MNTNPQVSGYINEAPAEQKQIMETIRQLLYQAVPGVTENYKWSRPVFSAAKDFAYLKTTKAYVALGFFSVEKLEDKAGLLEGTGKDMRHIKIRQAADIDKDLLTEWFKTLTT
jgi:hypothetical protein